MAKPDRSIDPRILESAKKEFLERGYETASLKTICENAEITTGALYKRYRGKEDLFCAVVADTVTALNT
ncbi:TetR/AcrR family transcriptional regulator, partial [Aminipila sp.]|uniref:TetR/AcrR family transcriptional regulator n=1 Tax=Aminipila sp. TaxID=2060095 RepID=UPI0028A1AC24